MIIQDLVSNGHSWSDVKQYTLSEIGVFISSIYMKKEKDRIDKFSMGWMSNNLTQEGMEQVIKNMEKSSSAPKKKVSKKEEAKDVAKDWSRLAAFQQR